MGWDQSLEDEIRVLRQQAAAHRLGPRAAPGNELLDYLRTLEPHAVAELTANADSDILGGHAPRPMRMHLYSDMLESGELSLGLTKCGPMCAVYVGYTG